MNVRTFDSGGAVVVNQRWIDEGVHDIFKEEEHALSPSRDPIRAILTDAAEKSRIDQLNGERIVMGAHTYRHRAEQLPEIMATGVTDTKCPLRIWSFILRPRLPRSVDLFAAGLGWYDRAQASMKTGFRRVVTMVGGWLSSGHRSGASKKNRENDLVFRLGLGLTGEHCPSMTIAIITGSWVGWFESVRFCATRLHRRRYRQRHASLKKRKKNFHRVG